MWGSVLLLPRLNRERLLSRVVGAWASREMLGNTFADIVLFVGRRGGCRGRRWEHLAWF